MGKLEKDSAEAIQLDIRVKGDKFLYYKRKFQYVENTIKVFPFWHSSLVWFFIAYASCALLFIYFLISQSNNAFITSFQNGTSVFFLTSQFHVYIFLLFPFFTSLFTFVVSYRLFNIKRSLAYSLIVINIMCNTLFIITFIKILQMHFALL